MIAAYFATHIEGFESGILDSPGQSSGLELVDLYEGDIVVKTFETRAEAEEWIALLTEEVS